MRPLQRTRPLALALAATAGLALLAAGCGREREGDLANGKDLFVERCGSCHILARAGTAGVQGPDLDAAFAAALRDGMNRSTVRGVVRRQIANVRRNSVMPADLVTGDDAQDVAAYVAFAAAKPGDDTGALAAAGQPEVSDRPIQARNGRLQIDADPSGALAFASTRAVAPPGQVELLMENPAPIEHNIAVRDGGLDEQGPVVGTGGTSRVSVRLDPGEYVFYCSVPGHEEGGMAGELTVER